MRVNRVVISLVVLSLALVAGCSGGGGNVVVGGGNTPVSLTITDTPPAGVTVLSFQVTVAGAVLNPNNVSLVRDRKSTRLNSSHIQKSRMPSSA